MNKGICVVTALCDKINNSKLLIYVLISNTVLSNFMF